MNTLRCSFISLLAAAAALLAGCAGNAIAPSPPAAQSLGVAASPQQVLAPLGRLRVGLYPGSPTSLIGDAGAADAKGLGLELGRALAQRLGVAFEPVVFAKNADLLEALKAARVDMSFTNATPERALEMDFSAPVLSIEKGYLVPFGSPIRELADVDRAGVRIGVSQGSSSERELAHEFKQAVLVPTATISSAIDMLASGTLAAFATNKAILFEMSDELPGSKVLAGHWGLESMAIAIPKGREAGLPLLQDFAREAQAQGLIARAVQRVGLRGTIAPP
jgi:polar amino acid transport system substrate-binding protein